jgi:hypothetical protein
MEAHYVLSFFTHYGYFDENGSRFRKSIILCQVMRKQSGIRQIRFSKAVNLTFLQLCSTHFDIIHSGKDYKQYFLKLKWAIGVIVSLLKPLELG